MVSLTQQQVDSLEGYFWSHVSKTDECWLWTGPITNSGRAEIADRQYYGMASLGSINKVTGAHRLAYMIYHGADSIPIGYHVMHLCNNGLCVRKEHLQAGTPQQNYLAALADGLAVPPKGEEHWNHVLTVEDVRGIRDLLAEGWDAPSIARGMGCSRQTVNDIDARRTWAWLD